MEYWLDVDTGIDDAIALLAAAGDMPQASVLGLVSTVAGNVDLASVYANTRAVLTAAGRADVPVFRGADTPLVRPRIDAAYVHGATGLGGVHLPAGENPDAGDLVALLRTLEGRPDGTVCLVATGPLTNVALLARLAPDVVRRKVGRTVWMGGGRGLGNTTPAAEFNAFADPEAVAVVLSVLTPVTVVQLGTTRLAYLTGSDVRELEGLGPRGRLARALLEDPAYGGMSRPDRVIVHDAVAFLEALHPGDLFETRREPVQVDLSGGPSYGATLMGRHALGPEADISGEPRRERFVTRLREALGTGIGTGTETRGVQSGTGVVPARPDP